ncbi:response regulator [Kurthia sibirica]|uniref:Transcriptional regulatory protein n=1 Tax=Kurthia sibirica TaxID=202750 RepID=A0A2U3AN19_9BACL|nr:response regulator [Kurthia sibirica]PWI25934.1 response regulator [Kurthia sibirica]GEK35138.1 putative C4-dicarboxylate response regulator DctR [Kurthia sibirica]
MITVVLVEDDPMVRQVNEQFLSQIKDIHIIGVAANGIEGLLQIKKLQPQLVIMDIFMPKQDGVETLQKIRDQGLPVDVITVTAANDQKTIEKVLQLGVYDYIMKPFSFERIQQTIRQYMHYKERISKKQELTQQELDAILHPNTNRSVEDDLPKGLNRATMNKILHLMVERQTALTAEGVASGIGLARVTARRYLDYLEKQKIVVIDIEYGAVGRPVNQYRLL